MANRLKKQPVVRYTPGTPYVPATPAYCTSSSSSSTSAKFGAGGSGSSSSTDTSIEFTQDGVTWTVTVDAPASLESSYGVSTSTTEVCYPATSEQPATAPSITYSAVNAWNAGARSIETLVGDGMFRFEVSAVPAAVVVGLSLADDSTLPSEQTHAFYVHDTVVDIIESGSVVATSAVAHDPATKLIISRENGSITYVHGGWTYTSAVMSFDEVCLDAAIYSSGDYVDNPELLHTPGVSTGGFSGTLPPMEFRFAELSTYTYADFTGRLPALFAELDGLTGLVGSFAGALPSFSGTMADGAYGEFRGALPLPGASFDGGFPQVSLSSFMGALPPLAGWHLGFTGEVGTFAGTLQPLSATLVDRAGYGEMRGTLPEMRGMLLSVPDSPSGQGNAYNTYLVVGDYLVGVRYPSGAVRSGLELGDSVTLSILLEETVFSTLALGSSTTAVRALSAVARSGLLLGGDASRGSANQQYAVNAMTAALSTYSGFAFNSFARAEDHTFAARHDGVYLLRPGDDDGTPLSVTIDFGESKYGSIKAKNVEDVFLGLTTDGEVIVTLRADGTDYAYKAVQRGAHHRVAASKGVNARRWNMVLEVVDATEFALDSMEHIINLSTRRWTK